MALLLKLERVIAFCCSIFLASVFVLVVLMRYVFKTDLFAYEEWVLIIAFLLYFIGGALASRNNTHIKADIVLEYIRTEHGRKIYAGCIFLLEAMIVVVLAWFAAKMVIDEFARWPNIPTTSVYKIPLAVPRFFIFAGLTLMALHAAVMGVSELRDGLRMRKTLKQGRSL